MEGKVILRDATRRDIESLLAVQQVSNGAAVWGAADHASLLEVPGTVCVVAQAPADGRLVGFVLARRVADEMEILNLAVVPAYRRRGIARRLLEEAWARAGAHDIRQWWLEVRASNQAARAFYRAVGFVEHSRRPRYYRNPVEDAVVCVRRLTRPNGTEP